MRHLLGITLLSFAFGCGDALPIADRGCPCTDGWICCASDNICVDEATACPGAASAQGGLSLLAGAIGGPGVVDGTGTEARVHDPRAGVDQGDRLYFLDGHLLRRLDRSTGTITTIAGDIERFEPPIELPPPLDGIGAAARFADPRGITAGPGGKLFVTDRDAVRVVDPATAAVTTLAVVPGATALGPIAYAPGMGGDAVVVADSAHHHLVRIDLATSQTSTLAGSADLGGAVDGASAQARFGEVTGLIFLEPSVLVTERTSGAVRAVDPTSGEVTTVLGVLGQTGEIAGQGAQARLGDVQAFYQGNAHPVLINRIGSTRRLIKLDYGVNSSFALVELSAQLDVELAEDAVLLGVDSPQPHLEQRAFVAHAGVIGRAYEGQRVDAIAGTSPAIGDIDGIGTAARLHLPSNLVVEGEDLYFFDNATIRRFHLPTAEVTTVAGRAGLPGRIDAVGDDARLPEAALGMVSDGAGHLFFINADGNSIRVLDLATRAVSTFAGTYEHETEKDIDGVGEAARFSSPFAMAMDGQGHLYVETFSATRKIDLATREVSTIGFHDYHLHSWGGVNISALAIEDGALIRAWGDGFLTRVSFADGSESPIAGHYCSQSQAPHDGIGAEACLGYIHTMVADGHGGVFLLSTEHTVRRVDLQTGAVSTVVGSADRFAVRLGALPAGLNAPSGLAMLPGPARRLVLTDSREPALLLADLP